MDDITHVPEFSVIVPVYKVERYLGRCIASVLAQTFADFELILIDDGSPDESGAICDRFAAEDDQIIVVHQQNRGVSAARNAGLDIARGKYIVFVDSDDAVEENYLECMRGYDADMVIAGVKNYSAEGIQSCRLLLLQNEYINVSEDLVRRMIGEHLLDYIWSKRYEREKIQKKGIRFDEQLTLGEDTLFVSQYLCDCDSVQLVSGTSYIYHQYAGSTLSSFSENYVSDLVEANRRILEALRSRFSGIGDSSAWKRRCWSVFYYSIFFVLRDLNASRDTKRALLTQYFSMPEYREYSRSLDAYMQDDPKIWRLLLRSGSAGMVMLGWKLSTIISKLKGHAT